MGTHILITGQTDNRKVADGDPAFVGPDGSITVTHFCGRWYSEDDPQGTLASFEGPRDDVIEWARKQGADDIQIQEPSGFTWL